MINQSNGLVEAPGIEPRDTYARNVAKRRENDADLATFDDERRREVSASMPADLDGAIGIAAKMAIDAGDLERARALIDLLAAKGQGATTTLLALAKEVPARAKMSKGT